MPKRPTGHLRKHGDHYQARIRFANGARPWLDLPPGLSEAQAKERARVWAERAAKSEYVAPPEKQRRRRIFRGGETVAVWWARWVDDRKRRGILSTRDDASRFRHHILPHLVNVPMADVNASDLESVRDYLDERIRAGTMSWRTASNVWTLVTAAFADAAGSKTRDLRVRADNPAVGIKGPDRGAKKAKQFLYPNEFVQLIECDAVPQNWRRIYALATYLYLRAGELEALDWADVDLVHDVVTVHRAVQTDRTIGPTKTSLARRVPIEPTLRPLLVAMRPKNVQRPRGPVVKVTRTHDRGVRFREHLERAGVTRWELHAPRDATRVPITFHDLRATGITWMAIRGDDPLRIKQRAGHRGFSTTEGYIREAENLRRGFGEVFPALSTKILE